MHAMEGNNGGMCAYLYTSVWLESKRGRERSVLSPLRVTHGLNERFLRGSTVYTSLSPTQRMNTDDTTDGTPINGSN